MTWLPTLLLCGYTYGDQWMLPVTRSRRLILHTFHCMVGDSVLVNPQDGPPHQGSKFNIYMTVYICDLRFHGRIQCWPEICFKEMMCVTIVCIYSFPVVHGFISFNKPVNVYGHDIHCPGGCIWLCVYTLHMFACLWTCAQYCTMYLRFKLVTCILGELCSLLPLFQESLAFNIHVC